MYNDVHYIYIFTYIISYWYIDLQGVIFTSMRISTWMPSEDAQAIGTGKVATPD